GRGPAQASPSSALSLAGSFQNTEASASEVSLPLLRRSSSVVTIRQPLLSGRYHRSSSSRMPTPTFADQAFIRDSTLTRTGNEFEHRPSHTVLTMTQTQQSVDHAAGGKRAGASPESDKQKKRMRDIGSSASLASSRSKRSRTRAIGPDPVEPIASAKHGITGSVCAYSPSRGLTGSVGASSRSRGSTGSAGAS